MEDILAVKNLKKDFKDFLAVDHVNFTARAGEIFGLLGPNGAGKTTTLRTIATVLAPSSGTANVAGFDIVKQPEEVRKRIGMLTTDIGVYERFTGWENLRYFGELYGITGEEINARIQELSQLLDMSGFIDKRAGKYSTGMKQKLAIARSVIHDPEVIIFDEPTAGLDVLASQTVISFMNQARDLGKLVILSTHEMTDAEKLCDRVAIMHQGRIVMVDTVANVKQKTGGKDLEDAFIRLVQRDGPVVKNKSVDKKRLISSFVIAVILRVLSFFLIGLAVLGSISNWFNEPFTYGLIIFGIILSFMVRKFKKNRKL